MPVPVCTARAPAALFVVPRRGCACPAAVSCVPSRSSWEPVTRACRAAWQPCRQRAAALRAAASSDKGSGSGSSGDDLPESVSAVPDTLPLAGVDTDWRAFRAKLVASASASPAVTSTGDAWAHSVPQPEQGCLLLANPLMFATSQTYFHMSVILIMEHNERGSMGIIINRPTEYRIGQLEGAAALQPEFNPCRLFLGGDVGGEAIHLLHDIRGLEGSSEVIPGIYMGGFQAAKRGLAEGRFSHDQFRVLTRYAGWGAGQLESECRRGVWLPVSASKETVLSPQVDAEGRQSKTADVWHHIANLVGGDLAMLSREVLGVADPEIAQAMSSGNTQPAAAEAQADKEGEAAGPAEGAAEEGEGGEDNSGGSGGSQQQQQQPRRHSKLPETDYWDGLGI